MTLCVCVHGMRILLTTLGLGCLSGTASATLLSADYALESGDNWITRDSDTGLDWLDVSVTAGQTFDEVRTGTWYASGFRHATRTELETLFINAGIPDDNFDVGNTHPAQALALAQLLGPTLVTGFRTSVLGLVGTDYLGNEISLLSHPLGNTFSALLGKVDYLSVGAVYGEAHFSGGHPFSNEADPNFGSFLVRTSVPEPSTVVMLLGGLVAMFVSRGGRHLPTPVPAAPSAPGRETGKT